MTSPPFWQTASWESTDCVIKTALIAAMSRFFLALNLPIGRWAYCPIILRPGTIS